MKKIIMALLMALLVFTVLPQQSDASSFREVKQTTQTLELRSAASPSAKAVTSLPKGTLVTQFTTVAGGWSHIKANQYSGYVPTKNLATPKSTIKIASSKSGLVVKETATRNANTLATLKYNMIVEDFGSVGGGWSFVQYGNVTGYVASSFIGTAKTTTKYVLGSGNYIVRNIASPSGVQKGTVKGGTTVTEHSQIAGWSYISSGNVRGYIPTSQLASKKPVVQPATLTTFTHLRPTKITWMSFYTNFVDDYRGSYSAYLDGSYTEEYDNTFKYGYMLLSGSGYNVYPPYQTYAPGYFALGMPETDWGWTHIETPLKQNVAKPVYYYEYDGSKEQTGNAFLRATNSTVTTPAGTFTNVVHIEEKFFSTSTSWHFYLAPGYGLIKLVGSNGQLYFELRDYY